MPFPAFFDDAPAITLFDPLAAFLGAPSDGMIRYGYGDAVRLAGHSCPTVAGAWLMSLAAMAALWPGAVPERGQMRVMMADAQDSGVTGVMAAVAGLVTGAAGAGGFKGIAGRFTRADLLAFGAATGAEMTFQRLDTGCRVAASYHPELVPADPEMRDRLQSLLSGRGDAEDAQRFAQLWQDRVKRILVDHADEPGLIQLTVTA
ncbi:hypothetical protein A6A04_00965 [Paramagnetospirillum marisnigri]|uniref:Formylmethanofuran dehydrogenase subunit E domain-containing protein n=1 Tax=Paramagnetospirillum marisnigri TaxID=1285242 RepID=A0A178MU10_9PROT|nr:hypothetical protein [Paramagnetospirillum marisnigri]OAN52296.1 hypothetical protein A6A04_00965 [Paramagnetospirillum marisnigri]